LALISICAWAVVSSYRDYLRPEVFDYLEPGWTSVPEGSLDRIIALGRNLKRADIVLRLLSAGLIAVHLVIVHHDE
jgi:hypothetical protein